MIRVEKMWVGASLFALAVSTATPTAAQEAAVGGRFTRYFAFGDSYSSGVGATPMNPDACRTSDSAWTARVHAGVGSPAFVQGACSGATTLDIMAEGPKFEAQGKKSQLALLPPPEQAAQLDGALITIQVGGNDLGLGEPLVECALGERKEDGTRGDVPLGCEALDDLYVRATDVVRDLATSLDYIYRSLRAAAPKATIVAIGYPHLVSTTNPACGGATAAALTLAERQKLNALVDAGNAQIKASAQAAGISAIMDEIATAFEGHEACSTSEWIVTPETSGVDLLNYAATKQYGERIGHPNDLGHKAIADVVLSLLPGLTPQTNP